MPSSFRRLLGSLLLELAAAIASPRAEVTRRAALQGGVASAVSIIAPATAVAPAAAYSVGSRRPSIALPGGGNFFWWQAGAVAMLASTFDLSGAEFVGGSAGAMSAVMAGAGISDFKRIFNLEERLLDEGSEEELQSRPPYRAGYIRRWLDDCLPADACERCNGRVHICVTELAPTFGTTTVSTYRDRDDLLDAVLASVHVPFWMDRRFCTTFRGTSCIDGSVYLPRLSEPSLLSRPPYTLPDGANADVRVFQFDDPRMNQEYDSLRDFLASKTPAQKLEMMEWGSSHIAQLDGRGELHALETLRKPRPSELRVRELPVEAEA